MSESVYICPICSSLYNREILGQGEVSFSTKRTQGAVLVMPHPASSEDVLTSRLYAEYMGGNCDCWLAYATRTRGCEVKMEDLMLVTGRDLTKSWIATAFTDKSVEGSIKLDVNVGAIGSARITTSIRCVDIQNAQYNYGPTRHLEEDPISLSSSTKASFVTASG